MGPTRVVAAGKQICRRARVLTSELRVDALTQNPGQPDNLQELWCAPGTFKLRTLDRLAHAAGADGRFAGLELGGETGRFHLH